MGAGKSLSIIGGIITLVAVFLTNFVMAALEICVPGGGCGSAKFGGNGLGGIWNMIYFIVYANELGSLMGFSAIEMYIMAVIAILMAASGPLILSGAKKRALSIIGCILPLVFGLVIVLDSLGVFSLNLILDYTVVFIDTQGFLYNVTGGILPLSIKVMNIPIGALLLLGGGIMGLIGGIAGRND